MTIYQTKKISSQKKIIFILLKIEFFGQEITNILLNIEKDEGNKKEEKKKKSKYKLY